MIDKSYEIYLALYQGLTGSDEEANAYKQFSPDLFDLIVIDECHRGSANEESAWREILTYFSNATHIGLTATPRETKETSNTEYFGEPVYTYSLKQGIDNGFLAPYKVIRVALNVDSEGYRPQQGKTDKDGIEIEDRIYNRNDFDRKLVIDERTDIIAQKVTEYLKGFDRFAKTIIFCVDIDHAERMRNAISRHNADLVAENYKYVMQITGDNDEGKRELDNFINPEEKYPVIATTSELMTTGVDAQTCKVIVLDANINSMTKFKQIVGRGTRINEEFDKLYFTILDFRNATDNFADPAFDGDLLRVKPITEDIDLRGIEDEEEEDETPIIDEVTGAEITIVKPVIRNTFEEPPTEYIKRPKQYINGVNVSVLVSRELFFDSNGKPITISLKDHTKEIIKGKYASLEDFLLSWNHADKKEAIIKELQEQGVMVEALYEAVDKQVDLFDLICHVAYDQPPLTRKERANNVKKRNYFTKYGDQARKVLETLLDKYADEGVENIESIEVLRVKPFDEYGSPIEIISHFGNKQHYLDAVKELETELYKQA
jgi:type I restriction enzyme R subunit